MSTTKDRKLLDAVRDVIRLMKSRDDLADGEKKIETFLTHLAIHGHVAPATQNQAMNALVFLYRKVLKQELGAPGGHQDN